VGKRGFLDGRAGFSYAVLQSFYEYMIVLKTKELAGKVESVYFGNAIHTPPLTNDQHVKSEVLDRFRHGGQEQ
jgi:hypothetical protein